MLFRYLVTEMNKSPGFRKRNGFIGDSWLLSDFQVHIYLNKKGLKGALRRLRQVNPRAGSQQPEATQIESLWKTFGIPNGQWEMEDTGSAPESADK